jgi:hypothetical protein
MSKLRLGQSPPHRPEKPLHKRWQAIDNHDLALRGYGEVFETTPPSLRGPFFMRQRQKRGKTAQFEYISQSKRKRFSHQGFNSENHQKWRPSTF